MAEFDSKDLGRVARVTTDKTIRELALPTKEPGTVIEFHNSADANPPMAMVHFDSAPADVTHMVPVYGGGTLPAGHRTMVQFEPPQGVHIDNSGSGGGGGGPMFCDFGVDEATVSVTFTLTERSRIGIVFNTDCGVSTWSIDGNTVTAPASAHVATAVTLDAGEHTISVTEAACGGG